MSKDNLSFSDEYLFQPHAIEVMNYRELLYNKFARNMTSLLESKRPRKYSSTRGLLDSRRLYRYKMDDNVFYKKTSQPTSDTTFIFLIDNSGSMSHRDWTETDGYGNPSRIEKANAIVSAFAKANKTVLGNKIKMEVFAKSESGHTFDSFVRGRVPILSRVFSNVKGDTNFDKILNIQCSSPVVSEGRATGSLTPEFLLLPTLMNWCKSNITTKNMVVINLTDGDIVYNFSKKNNGSSAWHSSATNNDTKRLRIKYLRGIPNTTVFLGSSQDSYTENNLKDIYGTNAVSASDENFETEFFKVINNLINTYA